MKVKLLVNAVSLSKIHTLSGSANAICLLELWIPIAHFNFHGLGKAREKGGRWGKGNWGNAKNPFTIRHVHVDGWITKGGRHIRCKWRQNLWFFPFENFSTNVHWAKCILQQFITLFHIVAGAAHLQITFWLLPIYCIFMVIR